MIRQPDDITPTETDQGETVGAADVQADVDRASGQGNGELSTDDYLEQASAAERASEDGAAVGAADAEEDRRRAE